MTCEKSLFKQILNLLGNDVEYHDVNEKVYSFAYSPKMYKYNIPVLPGTDLHAINKNYLSAIGTSRMWMDVEGETASDILSSMKKNIFERERKLKFVDSYASAAHVIGAFGIPMIQQALFGKKAK